MRKFEHEYVITSERANRRSDERNNSFYSDNEYGVGDEIMMDGIIWTIEMVVR